MSYVRLSPTIFIVIAACGCSSLAVDPIGPPRALLQPCDPDPDVVLDVVGQKRSGIGNIRNVRMDLLINGERIPMDGPEAVNSGVSATWRHEGDIPNDGHARFRYLLKYKVGYGFFSITGRGKTPRDRYYHRNVGSVTWNSDQVHETAPLPETFVDFAYQADERPQRTLKVGKVLTSGETGLQTDTAVLTLSNAHEYPIFVDEPSISLRPNGASVSDITITPRGGAATYPLTVPASGAVDFDVTYSANMDGSHSELRKAAINLSYTDTIRTCSFGPIWLDGSFFYNPQ